MHGLVRGNISDASVCPSSRPSSTLLVLVVLGLTSCQTAYYAALEKLGYPKRALLVSRVQQARDSQQAAKEQFQSTLERFRAVINVRGGELEATDNALSAELEKSEARAHAVHQRIAAVEEVADAAQTRRQRRLRDTEATTDRMDNVHDTCPRAH